MSKKLLVSFTAVLLLLQIPAAAQQTSARRPAQWRQTKTAWGDPDIQGVYTFATNTPFQRPAALADKNLTPAELEALDARRTAELEEDAVSAPAGSLGPSYNYFWESNEKGRLAGRASLISDPEDGLMPPMTDLAKKIRDEQAAEALSRRVGAPPFVHTLINTWSDHPMFTRCIARPMPRVAQEYNHGVQILQAPGLVAIHYESMHDVRIVYLDGRAHLPDNVRQWNGDSRGRWEGNTLVVDWTNFTDKQLANGASPMGGLPMGAMRFTERFTKIDANTINYEVTIDAPTLWTRPWRFILPWRSDDENYQNPEDLYEFACHEGNYRMMENSLSGSKALREEHQSK